MFERRQVVALEHTLTHFAYWVVYVQGRQAEAFTANGYTWN